MKLPSVKDLKVAGKGVLVRCDLDVPMRKVQQEKALTFQVVDDQRIRDAVPTIKYLLAQKAKYVALIGHIGRPTGKKGISTFFLRPVLSRLLVEAVTYWPDAIEKGQLTLRPEEDGRVALLENLRFYPAETANEPDFARRLASLAEFYVNDAFAVSHRQHASVVGLPRFLPSAFGFDFLKEVAALSRLRQKPRRPVVVILGGVKRSKITPAKKLIAWADYILIGGQLITYDGIPAMVDHHQKILGSLTKNGEDITIETVRQFQAVIAKAGTIVWSGPMGAFEEEEFARGTREIAKAVVASSAYTVVGGGDTQAALTKFGLIDKIDYISSGGGAMLAFLADGTLPGIEAIKKWRKTN